MEVVVNRHVRPFDMTRKFRSGKLQRLSKNIFFFTKLHSTQQNHNAKMDYTSDGPNIKPLLLMHETSSGDNTQGEFSLLANGQPAFERALGILHNVLPSADAIYIAVQSEGQMNAIKSQLSHPDSIKNKTPILDHEHDHVPVTFPTICPIFIEKDLGRGNEYASALLAANTKLPEANWLVLVSSYSVLSPPALQQLVLEFEPPVTCFMNSKGIAEPLVGIWMPAALGRLAEEVESGNSDLVEVVTHLNGRTVTPLRQEWLMCDKSDQI
jgi:hypothetical protein